jgi:hypothetical protein
MVAAALVGCGSGDDARSASTKTAACPDRSTNRPQTGTDDTGATGGPSASDPSGVGSNGSSTTSPAAQSRSGVAGSVAGESAEEEPSTTPSSGATTTTTRRAAEQSQDCADYSTSDDEGTGTGG